MVAALGQAIATSKTVSRPRVEALHEQLQRSRDGLVQHTHALHEPRAPWGIGLHGTGQGGEQGRGFYDWAVATDHAKTDTRLPLAALNTWTEVTHDRLREDIAELTELGGLAPDFADRPGWSVGHLRTPELVAEGTTRAGDLLDRLVPQLRKHLTASAEAAGVPVPEDVQPTWVQGLIELLSRAEALHADGASPVLDPAAVEDDALAELLYATGDRAYRKQHPQELGLLARRRARKRAHELLPLTVPADGLHDLLAGAEALRRDWQQWAPAQLHPVPVPDLSGLRAAAGQVQEATAQLTPFVQSLPLETMPFTQVESWLTKLRADRARNRLPRVFELRHRIVQAGAVAVLEDLRTLNGGLTPELARDRLSHAFAMTVIEHLDGSDPRIAGIDAGDLQRWRPRSPPETSRTAMPTWRASDAQSPSTSPGPSTATPPRPS